MAKAAIEKNAAATSASAASTSESNASTSESNALSSKNAAASSEAAAATSESNASTSESNAAASEAAAAASAANATTFSANYIRQNTAPNAPSNGDLWYDTNKNKLKSWDSSASAWRAAGGVTAQAAAPSSPNIGDLWVDTDNNNLFWIYNGAGSSGWSLVSNAAPEWTAGTGIMPSVKSGRPFTYNLANDVTDDVDTDTELTYTLIAGSMPPGMNLPTGTAFYGTAGNVGSDTQYNFTIQATDSMGGTSSKNYQITIESLVLQVIRYDYSAGVQIWNKPDYVTSINAAMWGAGGGSGNAGGTGGHGGGGGYTYGTIDVSNVNSLDMIVGQGGDSEPQWFNTGNGNGCGGGLTGIFTSFGSDRISSYNNSILIAGGGGGGGNTDMPAGSGGGSSGARGSGGSGGYGGTQSNGGTLPQNGNGTCTSNCTGQQLRGANGCGGGEDSYGDGGSWPSRYWGGVWSAGAGGNGCNAGGGGGGYWGGGGGGGEPNGGPGGGGSGYVGGHSSANVSAAGTQDNGISRLPAETGHTYYPGNSIGYGSNSSSVGNNGHIVIWYYN